MRTLIAAFTLALSLVAPHAAALTCGDEIRADVRLTADLVGCPGVALRVVGQSGIMIDLGGYQIASLASAEATIEVWDSHKIRIMGGTVGGPNTGIAVNHATLIQLEDLAFDGNATGIYLWSVYDSEISFNEFTNTDRSITIDDVDASNRVHVTSNQFEDNGSAMLIKRSHDNVVEGNTFRRNGAAILINSSQGNRVVHNGIFNSTQGVTISNAEPSGSGSHNNVITGNKIYDNLRGVIIRAPKSDRTWSKYNEIIKNAFSGGNVGVDIEGPRAYKTEVSDNGFFDIRHQAIDDGGTRTVIRGNRCSPSC